MHTAWQRLSSLSLSLSFGLLENSIKSIEGEKVWAKKRLVLKIRDMLGDWGGGERLEETC
jgi:hypothetical protein